MRPRLTLARVFILVMAMLGGLVYVPPMLRRCFWHGNSV